MLDALEKQLKNSKHEDGKLENFICFESKSKAAAAAVVVWGGFRRRGGYYGGICWRWREGVAGGGWRPLQPSGKSQSQTGNGSFCVALTVPTRIESPPEVVWAFNSHWGPENALLLFDSP